MSLEGRQVLVAGAEAIIVGIPFASRIIDAGAQAKEAVSAL